MEDTMTYDNDERLRPNANIAKNPGPGLSPFVLGAIVVALILGGVFLFAPSDTNTASNQNGTTVSEPARVAPPASTTGSGATSPAPARPGNPATTR
jgi:hypothetical protein